MGFKRFLQMVSRDFVGVLRVFRRGLSYVLRGFCKIYMV